MVGVGGLVAQCLVVAGVPPDLERARPLGDPLVVRDPRARSNDLHVAGMQIDPLAGGGVVVRVLTFEDERGDLESFVVVKPELEVVVEPTVRPVEEPRRELTIGAVTADDRLVRPEDTPERSGLELLRLMEDGDVRRKCCHVHNYTDQ
jgi:hypothetical protein